MAVLAAALAGGLAYPTGPGHLGTITVGSGPGLAGPPTSVTSPRSSPGTSSGPSTTFAGSPPGSVPCRADQLNLALVASGSVGRHVGVVIDISLVDQHDMCTLTGYPTVAGVLADGHTPIAATTSPRGPLGGEAGPADELSQLPLVVLSSAQSASALIEGTDTTTTGGGCPNFVAFDVTLPGETAPTRLTGTLADCSGLTVHPVVGGPTGGFGDHTS